MTSIIKALWVISAHRYPDFVETFYVNAKSDAALPNESARRWFFRPDGSIWC